MTNYEILMVLAGTIIYSLVIFILGMFAVVLINPTMICKFFGHKTPDLSFTDESVNALNYNAKILASCRCKRCHSLLMFEFTKSDILKNATIQLKLVE